MYKLFTASWCKPCQELKSWMASRDISDIEIIDIDESPAIARTYEVVKVPTLVQINDLDKSWVGREEIKPRLEFDYEC